MPPLTLEGDTLGEKRRHFNKLVEDAVVGKNYKLCHISADDSDIDNLLKIDIACKTRNVEYIIEVMKSNDMLYAATAIKKSTWLITEQQYANIINPEYLHTQLLPSLNTKTFNKLMLHIRLHLKDESRVETFYEYLSATKSAHKWLEKCSIPFIEDVITNKRLIPISLFKRLCRRSAHFITYYTRVVGETYFVKQAILFLLKSHTVDVLNVLEQDYVKSFPTLSKKKTKILMKTYSQKVLDNFAMYGTRLDIPTVLRYVNKKETKTFLCEQVKKCEGIHSLCFYDNLGHFIRKMPEEERFQFVKKTFVDKTELTAFSTEYGPYSINWHIKPYRWYEFAPFNIAFTELEKLIRKENSPSERQAMFSTLITCARRNTHDVKTLLTFFKDLYINEPFKFKMQFVSNLLSTMFTHQFDVETWNILDQLFHSMEVYMESNNNVQLCLESIILYKVSNNEPVPKIVERKLTFNTFVKVQRHLNPEQKNTIFTYLLNSVLNKVQNQDIENVSNLVETMGQIHNALNLLKDWNKDIIEYPLVLEKIQELTKKREENMWKTDMSCLYNVKKSWRKHMFEESLSLSLSEEACLNALKHKPQLLTRHDKQIDTLRTDDAVSLPRLLAKLRVYWPHSLAHHWADAYRLHLNKPTGHKATIKGLFALLDQKQIIEMAKSHMPDNNRICEDGTNPIEISIKRNIAKYLHLARPLIPLDTMLWYVKGGYLKYAVPSLNAILSNMSEIESLESVPKLLDSPDSPVTLRKFGLNLTANKLKHDDQKTIFFNVWKNSKNFSIRSALFKRIYTQISLMAHYPNVQKDLWKILSSFIDNLTKEESEEIFKIFGNFQNVPIAIQEDVYMKSYEFLTALPADANCEKYVKCLIEYAPKIMEYLDKEFVADKILSPAGFKFCSYESEVLEVFACYVLCGKSEADQLQRFKKVVEPAMEEAFKLWDSTHSGRYYVKDNFNKFLNYLIRNFKIYYLTKKDTSPVQLFVEIKQKMEAVLSLLDNYVLYTSWKLITEYVKVMDEHKAILNEIIKPTNFYQIDFGNKLKSKEMDSVWKDIHKAVAPSLGPVIVKCLKDDSEKYNMPTIYCVFAQALDKMFKELSQDDDEAELETLIYMLDDKFDPSYLLVSKLAPTCYFESTIIKSLAKARLQIRLKLEAHPSEAVRMHCCHDFRNISRFNDLM